MWPFSQKKKVPRVPFPEPRPLDEGSLRFPRYAPQEKIIQPEKIQEAAGIKEEMLPPEEDIPLLEETPMAIPSELPFFQSQMSKPLFIKKDVYQRILGELESLKGDLFNLSELNRDLEKSEYNEENNYVILRKSMKSIHDRCLQIDKILFKL